MNQRVNKKGESSTITIIIAIVLGVAVLVFLIFGFSSGWNNLWDRISNLGGGKANLDTIVSACNLACSTGATSDYCTQERTIKFGKNVDTWTGEKVEPKSSTTANCNEINKNPTHYPGLVVSACPEVQSSDPCKNWEHKTPTPTPAA